MIIRGFPRAIVISARRNQFPTENFSGIRKII